MIEKENIHPRKYGISSERRTKDDENVYSVKYT